MHRNTNGSVISTEPLAFMAFMGLTPYLPARVLSQHFDAKMIYNLGSDITPEPKMVATLALN